MRKFIGEEKLLAQAEVGFPKEIKKILDNIYFVIGYGGSNAIFIEAETSCILIDTLNGTEVAEEALKELRKITHKPIKTIIYTHYHHFDHTSGAGVFADEDCQIIGRKPTYPQYGKTHLLKDIYGVRGAKQFGTGLSLEEVISVGIGPRNNNNGQKSNLQPNVLFSDEKLKMHIDGIDIELVAAPGETDDQIFVWLPQFKVLCCGDNYYESWPNLYAIRGGQYRDISSWIDALSSMLEYNAEYLLPGHTRAVIGCEKVKEYLTNYRDAILYILEETLKGMNKGLTMDQLVDQIKLPNEFAKLPYLQEYYGTIEWTIRSIFTGYLGWFDGNALHLSSMPEKDKSIKLSKMMGGYSNIICEIKEALQREEDQWALELCEILTNTGELTGEVKALKAEALMNLGRMQTSANGRHYYIATAKQLLGQLESQKLSGASLDATKK